MKEFAVAKRAAQAAGKLIRKYYGKKFAVRHKGEINLVTEIDEKAQKIIVQMIRKAFPHDAILAEELDLSKTASAPRRWIIDPLDGTTNFAHGYPRFCVSIAFEEQGQIRCGVIFDPIMNEEFSAVHGKGAKLNSKPLRVSKCQDLKQALLVTGFPYDLNDPEKNNVPYFLHFLKRAQALRRDGSAALNLAYVAAGRFDGFWELGLSPWDIAAGILLIREAGGEAFSFQGRKTNVSDSALVAGSKAMVEKLLKEIESVRSC